MVADRLPPLACRAPFGRYGLVIMDNIIPLELVSKTRVGKDFCILNLEAETPLLDHGPGAHISLKTPSGWRNYSLASLSDGKSWQVAVKAERTGRGGSVWITDSLEPGMMIDAQPPSNSFPLEDADDYLLIAGGIGITPILSMARQLDRQGKRYELIYCVRDNDTAVFRDEVAALNGAVTIHADNGSEDEFFDFWPLLETPDKKLVYCCGPKFLMEDIADMSGHWPSHQIHFEDFKPVERVRPDDKPFDIQINNSDQKIYVPADKTALEALRDAGFDLRSSCESGTCGTCRVRHLSGEVIHHDLVLSGDQKEKFMMLCVSRGAETIEIDISE
ncbi:MAG: PDR/VanB family oxidoreductase [Candidatus Puniceispirillaceae bacterium]